MTDQVLLRRFVETRDQSAFAELVRRHGPWILSSARRQLHDPHLAEDVMQVVFVLLARKSRKLLNHANMAGWLFTALRYAASAQQRTIVRQRRREARAMELRPAASRPDADWSRVAPELDPAVAKLRAADREAILLRYYQGLSVAECAAAMRIGEEAAKKRLQRALDRLRELLQPAGVAISAGALSAVLVGQTAQAAPAGVMQSAVAAAIGATPAGVGAIASLASRSWGLAHAKLVVLVMVPVLAILAIPALALLPATVPATSAVPTRPAPAVTAANAHRTPNEQTRIRAQIWVIRNSIVFSRGDEWAGAIRELAQVGDAAVPDLVAELDRTNSDAAIRGIAFTLRAIGDPAAVPALLRALPKCSLVASTCGIPCTDPALLQWMKQHSVSPGEPGDNFTYDTADGEILKALESLTGHTENLPRLAGIIQDDAATQARATQYRKAAVDRWTAWWQANKASIVTPEQEQSIAVGAATDQEITQAALDAFGSLFPVDAAHRPGPIVNVFMPTQNTEEWDVGIYYSFATGSFCGYCDSEGGSYEPWFVAHHVSAYVTTYLRALPTTAPAIAAGKGSGAAAAARAMADRKWDMDNPILRLEGRNVHTWQVENSVWDGLDQSFAAGKPLDSGSKGPRADFIPFGPRNMPPEYDVKGLPLTFLFTTGEGVRGILQVVSLEIRPKPGEPVGMHVRYRLMGVSTEPVNAVAVSAPTVSARHYAQIREVTLGDSFSDMPAAANLLTGKTALIPAAIRASAFTPKLHDWMRQNDVHVISRCFGVGDRDSPLRPGEICGVAGEQMKIAAVSRAAWENLSCAQLAEIMERKAFRSEAFATISPVYHKLAPINFAFETADHHQGLLQIAAIDDKARTIVLRWKMVE